MPMAELVQKVLDGQVRRTDDDGRAGDDDDDVEAVDEDPACELAGIPARLADAEARQRDGDGGEHRDTVGEQREGANRLRARACTAARFSTLPISSAPISRPTTMRAMRTTTAARTNASTTAPTVVKRG